MPRQGRLVGCEVRTTATFSPVRTGSLAKVWPETRTRKSRRITCRRQSPSKTRYR
ncbi:hypothetical protein SFR_1878 [Streptomyces sp. FR-008]|nr:hypothetical protein SFR_1878 [Streptomyces sp. FR-008]